jgi:hypothetical protein
MQLKVLKVQIQPPVGSVSAVAVSPAGKVRVKSGVLSIGVVVLVFVTFTVTISPFSP